MNDITKLDWKLFQERVPEWQEHYMERLIKEYVELLTSPGKASDHFWKLEKRIKQDKKYQGVQMQLSKSTAIWDCVDLFRSGAITMEDLNGFSENFIDTIKFILSR